MTGPDTTPPPAGANRLPRHTTPTWEVELLISAAAVFAMLQLSGWLDERMLKLMPRLTADLGSALMIVYFYLKSAATILAVTFALHLALRAHWIALVGMHSVFPDGVHWDRLRMGPVQRDVTAREDTRAETSIENADNRATIVFAGGVMIGAFVILLGVIAGAAIAATMAVNRIGGIHADPRHAFMWIGTLFILPLILATAVDFMFGRHLRREGPVWHSLAAAFSAYWRLGILRGFSTSNLLISHGGQKRVLMLAFAIFAPVMALVAFNWTILNSPAHFGSYALFPRPGADSARSVDSAYYDDQRDPLHDPAVPFVRSAIATGDYLTLVVPYEPTRDNAALEHGCADALAMPEDDARAVATLDCLARLHAVSMDGTPLASLHYDASSDARTDRPTLQAMIDIRALASGRHELRVARAPALPGGHHKRDKVTAYTIPFWR